MKVYQLKLLITDSNPIVWRRIKVKSNISLESFHEIIQVLMNWTGDHLHQFVHNNNRYGDDMFCNVFFGQEVIEYEEMGLDSLIDGEGQHIRYDYDFKDNWHVDIVLEKIITDERLKHPVCTEGEMAGPVEDCGGITEYSRILNIYNGTTKDDDGTINRIANKGYTDFNPHEFDLDFVNSYFEEEKFYYIRKEQ